MILRIIILCFTLSFISSTTITGRISDEENGTPLIGSSVYLEGTSYGATTDEFGQYILMAVPNGEYNLIVKYLGYQDFIQKISITEDKQMVMNFSLKLSNIEVKGADIIGNVEKQDKITNAPATKETISSEKIQIQSSTNLGSYLKGLKGVD